MKFGKGRKWGKQPAAPEQPPLPDYVVGAVVERDGVTSVRTTVRGYAFLWAMGYRCPTNW